MLFRYPTLSSSPDRGGQAVREWRIREEQPGDGLSPERVNEWGQIIVDFFRDPEFFTTQLKKKLAKSGRPHPSLKPSATCTTFTQTTFDGGHTAHTAPPHPAQRTPPCPTSSRGSPCDNPVIPHDYGRALLYLTSVYYSELVQLCSSYALPAPRGAGGPIVVQ